MTSAEIFTRSNYMRKMKHKFFETHLPKVKPETMLKISIAVRNLYQNYGKSVCLKVANSTDCLCEDLYIYGVDA